MKFKLCYLYLFALGLLQLLVYFAISLLYWHPEDTGTGSSSFPANHTKSLLHFLKQSQPDEWGGHDTGQKDLPDLLQMAVIRRPEDQILRTEGLRRHGFNMLVSDRVGLYRNIPDVRHRLCKGQAYHGDLPSASIVICFYNEAWSVLLRTIHTILRRTPSHLLHEIVLVDDYSDIPDLGTPLTQYVTESLTSSVRLIRTSKREGLIRARIIGADAASGKVLVFLDSHCEVNVDWLPPLLSQISRDRRNVALPIVDIIDHDTFQYESSPLVRGGFNWGMFFRWDDIPENLLSSKASYVQPIQSPTMSGGLFAIDRLYFNEIGKYDKGLEIWGGENLEISFRIWQCGGRIDIIPCSRIGHLFRDRRPYGSTNGDSHIYNSLRVAHVWMDQYKEYFFLIRPDARNMSYGDISDRVSLRLHLRCNSFEWYLHNVYPEQTLPNNNGRSSNVAAPMIIGKKLNKVKDESTITRKGHLRHRASGLCVVADRSVYDKRSLVKLSSCFDDNREQLWYELKDSSLQLARLLCLEFDETLNGRSFPQLMKCHYSGGNQQWMWTKSGQLLNPASGMCASPATTSTSTNTFISLEICNATNTALQFYFYNTL